jgi:hypothetical protein
MRSRSRFDLMQWAAELIAAWGVHGESGLHLIAWSHADFCPLHPDHAQGAWNCCQCAPDGVLVVDIGTAGERRIAVVRDGITLPVRGVCD